MVEEIPTPELIKRITSDIYSVGVAALDAPLRCKGNEDGNSLLHFAVMFGLYSDVEQILNLGASSSRKNKVGVSPKDIAVDQGDQIMIQKLGRRDKYRKQRFERTDSKTSDNDISYRDNDEGNAAHASTRVSDQSEFSCNIKCCFDTRAISNSSYGSESFSFADTDHKVLEWRYNVEDVYEDYLDWTDSTKAKRLQNTLEKLRSEESSLQKDIKDYTVNKETTKHKLSSLFYSLRESEHSYCLQIWNVVEEERKSRSELQRGTIDIASCKQALQMLKKRILWTGRILIRRANLVLYSWDAVNVLVGTEFLTFYSEDNSAIVARVPPECIKSLVVNDKEVTLYIEKCLDHLYDIPHSIRDNSKYSHAPTGSNLPDVSILISFDECQKNKDSKASNVPDCIRFLNSICCLSSEISIVLISSSGDMTTYRPSTADDSDMTSLESLTLSSRGTFKDENEVAHATPTIEENTKKDRLSHKSDGERSSCGISSGSGGLNTGNISSDIDGNRAYQNNEDGTSMDKSGVIYIRNSDGSADQMSDYHMIPSTNRCRAPSEGDLSSLIVANCQHEDEILYKNDEKTQTVSSNGNSLKLFKFHRKQEERSCSLSFAGVNSNAHGSAGRDRDDRRTVSVLESDPEKRYLLNDLPNDCSRNQHNSDDEWGHRSEDVAMNIYEKGLLSTIESYTLKIDRLRSARAAVESRLVKAISERESLLEILYYLQSLKSLVSNPPQVPSRLMGTVSLPSIDKAMAAYSECRERVDKAIDENCSIDIDESQLFIASMLGQTRDIGKKNDSTPGDKSEESGEDSIYSIPIDAANRRRSSKRKTTFRRLGPPPKDVQQEFEQVIAVLEELWTIDIGTFETVDKLSQILLLRERTWKSLSALQVDNNNLSQGLDDSDLFDVII